jgi:hypothetical protein
MLSFSPPRTPDKAARNTVEVKDIATLRRRVRTWQLVAILLLITASLAAGAAVFAAWRYHTRALIIEADAPPQGPATFDREGNGNHLRLPEPPVAPGDPCPGWRIFLGNRYRQRVEVLGEDPGPPSLLMTSETLQDELCVSAAPLNVMPGTHVYPEALFLKAPRFEGHIAIVVSLTRQGEHATETISHFYVKEPNQLLPGGWRRAKQKFDVPAHGTRIQFHIRGNFKGQVKVRGPSLTLTTPVGIKATPTPVPQTPQTP